LTNPADNRFEDFFNDHFYVSLKNSLYNYRLRRRAVRKCVHFYQDGLILEVGSGLSPMLGENRQVFYSDLSLSALKSLRQMQMDSLCVEADALRLPFRTGAFSTVVCSEVIEHIPDDLAALREMARVMTEEGTLILTFPHRRAYFAIDDRFVHHFRRYELAEIEEKLRAAGLEIVQTSKVLGPLEKITMMIVAFFASRGSQVERKNKDNKVGGLFMKKIVPPFFRLLNIFYCLPVAADACIFPRKLASVILVRAGKQR